ncbi:MAG: hypothetical protein KDJ38_00815 [Gammaproteobacteria bacterium]|nr:hypothetical protein [Gammaproteobacteria bacterium]
MSNFIIPKKLEVQQMLGMLYDGEIDVEESDVLSTDAGSKTRVAVYIDDNDQPVCACTCDFPFTAYAGGALTKIPKAGAEEAANNGDFSEMMLSNLNEVMNICSRLFMSSKTPHLRLDKTYGTPDEAPETVTGMLSGTLAKAGFQVKIDGYGSGKLSFVAT